MDVHVVLNIQAVVVPERVDSNPWIDLFLFLRSGSFVPVPAFWFLRSGSFVLVQFLESHFMRRCTSETVSVPSKRRKGIAALAHQCAGPNDPPLLATPASGEHELQRVHAVDCIGVKAGNFALERICLLSCHPLPLILLP